MHLSQLSNELEEIGYLGYGLRATFSTRAILKTGKGSSLSRVINRKIPISSILTAANCLGIVRRERKAGRGGKMDPLFRKSFISDTPLLVQRRGGFGYTKAKNYSPTIRAQTGRHQGGHTDRPILCGQKLDLERMRETDGLPRGLDGRRGRLIGNAVAPPLAQAIAERIVRIEQTCKLGMKLKVVEKKMNGRVRR